MDTLVLNQKEKSIEQLSNSDLHSQTLHVAHEEKQATLKLLHHLHEVQRRKLYAELGYASLWDYSMRALQYSETQTAERISAMRLMFRTEQARVALESGSLNITQAAMAERHLRAEEKSKGALVSTEEVHMLLGQIEGQTKRETEKLLMSLKPEAEQIQERVRVISAEVSEVKFPVSEETQVLMQRFWEIRGRCSISDVFSTCLTFFLDQKDPARTKKTGIQQEATLPVKLQKPETQRNSRYIQASVKRAVREQSEGQCQYVNPLTHRRCESKYLLQYDHIRPYAVGGSSDAENLRMLCRSHNLYLAEKMFTREMVESYLSTQSIDCKRDNFSTHVVEILEMRGF